MATTYPPFVRLLVPHPSGYQTRPDIGHKESEGSRHRSVRVRYMVLGLK
jgi:hypothetical protein